MTTFRVENGLLTVGYERYGDFGGRFGHLFYREPFSRYRLLVEYRFVGEQASGGEAWARANSGVMIHAQSPGSMLRDQDFPVSLEAQLLAGSGAEERPTANLCTPGTQVMMAGRPVDEHCLRSSTPTYPYDRWVVVELIVRGDRSVVHVVEGDTVLAYERPTVGGGMVNGYDPAAKPDGTSLSGGYVALQSESHPIQFRRVLIRPLSDGGSEPE